MLDRGTRVSRLQRVEESLLGLRPPMAGRESQGDWVGLFLGKS